MACPAVETRLSRPTRPPDDQRIAISFKTWHDKRQTDGHCWQKPTHCSACSSAMAGRGGGQNSLPRLGCCDLLIPWTRMARVPPVRGRSAQGQKPKGRILPQNVDSTACMCWSDRLPCARHLPGCNVAGSPSPAAQLVPMGIPLSGGTVASAPLQQRMVQVCGLRGRPCRRSRCLACIGAVQRYSHACRDATPCDARADRPQRLSLLPGAAGRAPLHPGESQRRDISCDSWVPPQHTTCPPHAARRSSLNPATWA